MASKGRPRSATIIPTDQSEEYTSVEHFPPVTALSLQRSNEGWFLVTYTIINDQITNITKTNPNSKLIAIEDFKLGAVNHFEF